MIQADLWGNATVRSLTWRYSRTDEQDLSLLVDLNYADLQKLQAVGAKAQAEQAQMILRNDLPKVWDYLKTIKSGRVDIVLDNGMSLPLYKPKLFADHLAGFEVYDDLRVWLTRSSIPISSSPTS